MPRSKPPVSLSTEQRKQLLHWLAAQGTPQQVALRCRIVLAAADGQSDPGIATDLKVSRPTVILWRVRFAAHGLESLWRIAPGPGRKPTYGAEKIKAVVDATLQSKPKGMTQWSCRLMARSQGLSKSTVSNIWRSHNLKPHRVKTFKLSRDAKFLEKLTDVVGLHLNSPEKALVLCLDEKSQIQALDRTQPGLPMTRAAAAPGRVIISAMVRPACLPRSITYRVGSLVSAMSGIDTRSFSSFCAGWMRSFPEMLLCTW